MGGHRCHLRSLCLDRARPPLALREQRTWTRLPRTEDTSWVRPQLAVPAAMAHKPTHLFPLFPAPRCPGQQHRPCGPAYLQPCGLRLPCSVLGASSPPAATLRSDWNPVRSGPGRGARPNARTEPRLPHGLPTAWISCMHGPCSDWGLKGSM